MPRLNRKLGSSEEEAGLAVGSKVAQVSSAILSPTNQRQERKTRRKKKPKPTADTFSQSKRVTVGNDSITQLRDKTFKQLNGTCVPSPYQTSRSRKPKSLESEKHSRGSVSCDDIRWLTDSLCTSNNSQKHFSFSVGWTESSTWALRGLGGDKLPSVYTPVVRLSLRLSCIGDSGRWSQSVPWKGGNMEKAKYFNRKIFPNVSYIQERKEEAWVRKKKKTAGWRGEVNRLLTTTKRKSMSLHLQDF